MDDSGFLTKSTETLTIGGSGSGAIPGAAAAGSGSVGSSAGAAPAGCSSVGAAAAGSSGAGATGSGGAGAGATGSGGTGEAATSSGGAGAAAASCGNVGGAGARAAAVRAGASRIAAADAPGWANAGVQDVDWIDGASTGCSFLDLLASVHFPSFGGCCTGTQTTDTARLISKDMHVVVKMHSYFSLPDGGRKTYCSRKTLAPVVVDANSYGLMQLIDHIAANFIWGSKQYITLYGSNGDKGDACVRINSDEQLHDLFELNIEKGMIEIVAQINDFDGPLQFSPTKRALHPSVRDRVVENQNTPSLDPHIDATELIQSTPTKERVSSTSTKKDKKYEGAFKPMTSQHLWSRVEVGYKINKPKLRRKPGRPRVSRIKASDELRTKKRKCSECNELGHTAKYCQRGPTAKEKKRRATLENSSSGSARVIGVEGEHASASNDPIVGHTSSARAMGAEGEHASASDVRSGRPPRGRGRARGRARGRGLGAWFGI